MIWVQLLMWVVSFVLTDYFRERLPSQTASGLGDFNIPTATEGRPVPICIGGTVRFESPNCIWYGDFTAVERTIETGLIFKRDEVIGFEYLLALQYALYKGPSAGITGVWIGDDRVFNHIDDAGGIPQAFVDVDRDDLFGGPDHGGGFVGRIRLFDGAENQAVSAFLSTRLDPLPAYTGLSYILVTDIAETTGANIGEANQLRYIRVELQTFDDLAGTAGHPGLGDSLSLGNDTHFIGPDLNPIVAAWDVWTNARWGRGFGLGDVDIASFQAAAATCFAEGLGWTNVQDEQTTTGAIQDLIEQHIDGYIGPNPLTGLIEVTLARPDYVVLDLPLVTDVGIAANLLEVKQWDQGDWSNTKNRIRIRYTSRDKDWKETHAVETAAGNRIIQGRTVTTEVRFPGCHTTAVAQIIAAREKRGLSIPLQKGTLLVNRTAYELRPGQVFRLTSNQSQTVDLPVRVTKMSLGDTTRQSLELSVVEDIFGNEPATVEPTPASDFVPPVQVVAPFLVADQAAFEAPFILMRGDEQPNTVPRIATIARRIPGNAAIEYEVIRRTGNPPAGAYTSTGIVRASFATVGTLRNNELGAQSGQGGFSMQIDPIGAESLDSLIQAYSPSAGNFAGVCVIGPGLASEEFIIFDEIVVDGAGIRLENVYRAVMDTFWKAHNAGERIWFIWTGGLGMSLETYAQGLGVEMKFLPRSPNDAVVEASAVALPVVTIDDVTGNRQNKPLLPADVTFENEGFWPSTSNFDALITPDVGGDYTGQRLVPQHRLWRTQDIFWSVTGLDVTGGSLDPDELDSMLVSIWIHDLDQFPAADRADSLFEILDQVVVTASDEILIPKADLITGGAIGLQFNARLEIETKHSPASEPASNVSHLPGFFDFLATGAFSVEVNDALLVIHFDGVDAATVADDVSPMNQFIEFSGAAEIDTAEFVFGGASLLLDGIDSFVRVPFDRRFDLEGDWTVECRIRFAADPAGDVWLCSQMASGTNSWGLFYSGGGNRWRVGYSTTGVNGPFAIDITSVTWIPVADTWYKLSITKTAADIWHVFIDGVRIGVAFSGSPTWFRSSNDLIIGAQNFNDSPALFFDGHIEEFRITQFALYLDDYTPQTQVDGFDDARANTPFLCHFEDTDAVTTTQSDDLNDWEIDMGGTTQIDTAQFKFGSSSLLCNGFNSTTRELSDGAWIEDTVQPDGGRRRAAFDLRTREWTMEMFVRFNVLPAGDGSALFGKYARGFSSGFDWYWYVTPSLTISFFYSPTGNIVSSVGNTSAAQTIVVDTWYHFALERVGNDLHQYFEGTRIVQAVGFFDSAPKVLNDDGPGATGSKNNPISIGQFYSPNTASRHRALDGWIDEARIVYGAIYNAATYTIPPAPFTDPRRVISVPNDRDELIILDHFEGADFFATDHVLRSEDRLGARLIFAGNARLLDSNPKFGVTHLNLAGTDDYVLYHVSRLHHRLLDDDFTIDIQYRPDILPHDDGNGGHCLAGQWADSGNLRSWALYLDDAGTTTDLVFAWSDDGTVVKTAFVIGVEGDIAILNYHHIQVGREGSTLRLWIDGNLQTLDGGSDSIGSDVIFDGGQGIRVGWMNDANSRDLDGQLDEFRMIRVNEQTGNFTPPTAAYADPLPIEEDPWY